MRRSAHGDDRRLGPCRADPTGDMPSVLLALAATFVATEPRRDAGDARPPTCSRGCSSRRSGRRRCYRDRVPKTPGRLELSRSSPARPDWAVVGVAAVRMNGGANVSLTNMGLTPMRAPPVRREALAGRRRPGDRRRARPTKVRPPVRLLRIGRVPARARERCSSAGRSRRRSRSASAFASVWGRRRRGDTPPRGSGPGRGSTRRQRAAPEALPGVPARGPPEKFGEGRAGQLAALIAYRVLPCSPCSRVRHALGDALRAVGHAGSPRRRGHVAVPGDRRPAPSERPVAPGQGCGPRGRGRGCALGRLAGIEAAQNAMDHVWDVPMKRQPSFPGRAPRRA